MPTYQLAQINIARFVLPVEHPDNADFMGLLDTVNAQADAAPGFVWRMVGAGNNAMDIRAVAEDPRLIVNISVWRDVDALAAFVYRQADHRAVMKQRRRWFETIEPSMALWWVAEGHQPLPQEGLAKLDHLARRGPTPVAFMFRTPFSAPDEPTGPMIL